MDYTLTIRAEKQGRVNFYKADNDYSAGLLIEALRAQGFEVTLLHP